MKSIPTSIEIRVISGAHTHALRQTVLQPNRTLAQMVYPGDDEAQTRHFGAFLGGEIVGIASIYREPKPGSADQNGWRLRGMATGESARLIGAGGALLQRCLNHVAEQNGDYLWCNAREIAVGFYRRYSFKIESERFEIEDVGPHYVMSCDCN